MPSCEQCIELDLSKYSEAVRRELYDRIREHEFLGSAEEADEGDERPGEPSTAEAAELQIHFFAGRWLAQWRRPGVPESEPEARRIELLRIKAADDPRGYMLHEC